jgi:hypothetical protein
VSENNPPLPDFTRWPSFPFEGNMRVKALAAPVEVEPPRSGEDASDCVACNTPDDSYIWVSDRWRVRAMDRPTGLPMVLILECRSHLDMGDLPNLLAAELGVMTVRLERAIRSLDGVARVHVNRWGDGSAHLHMWFLARPYGRLQLRGTFLSLWDDILPVIPEQQWRENLALVAAWLAEFGGHANAEPAHIQWQSPSTLSESPTATEDSSGQAERTADLAAADAEEQSEGTPSAYASGAQTQDLSGSAARAAAMAEADSGTILGDGSEAAKTTVITDGEAPDRTVTGIDSPPAGEAEPADDKAKPADNAEPAEDAGLAQDVAQAEKVAQAENAGQADNAGQATDTESTKSTEPADNTVPHSRLDEPSTTPTKSGGQ